MQHITWTITFDRQWVNERLVAEDRRVPRDEEEWVRVMSRLQTAMDNCTAGESIDEAISGVVGTLEQHDYNVCPNTDRASTSRLPRTSTARMVGYLSSVRRAAWAPVVSFQRSK